jgi:hypothetical protein
MSGFGTLMLLFVVARMLLLGILGFIFLLGDYNFVGGTCNAGHSKLYKLIFLFNQSSTRGIKSEFFISCP